jgi:hypothetical protein
VHSRRLAVRSVMGYLFSIAKRLQFTRAPCAPLYAISPTRNAVVCDYSLARSGHARPLNTTQTQ